MFQGRPFQSREAFTIVKGLKPLPWILRTFVTLKGNWGFIKISIEHLVKPLNSTYVFFDLIKTERITHSSENWALHLLLQKSVVFNISNVGGIICSLIDVDQAVVALRLTNSVWVCILLVWFCIRHLFSLITGSFLFSNPEGNPLFL